MDTLRQFAESAELSTDIYSLCAIAVIAAGVPLIVGLMRLPVAEVVLLLAAGACCRRHRVVMCSGHLRAIP